MSRVAEGVERVGELRLGHPLVYGPMVARRAKVLARMVCRSLFERHLIINIEFYPSFLIPRP